MPASKGTIGLIVVGVTVPRVSQGNGLMNKTLVRQWPKPQNQHSGLGGAELLKKIKKNVCNMREQRLYTRREYPH